MEFKVFRGISISVHQDGTFSARVNGQRIEADTLKALEDQIQKRRKKAKVKLSIPLTWLGWKWHPNKWGGDSGSWSHGAGVRHVALTGMHSSNENLLVRDELTDETTQQSSLTGGFNSWSSPTRRLTDDESAEYVRLYEARSAADEAYHEFVKARQVDARELVRQALADKADDPGETEVAAELAEDGDPR